MFFFFFSSRRRHTRLQGDWSSTCALPISARRDVRAGGAAVAHLLRRRGNRERVPGAAGARGDGVHRHPAPQAAGGRDDLEPVPGGGADGRTGGRGGRAPGHRYAGGGPRGPPGPLPVAPRAGAVGGGGGLRGGGGSPARGARGGGGGT